MPVKDRTYTAAEACDIAGITYRMLDYWLRAGHIAIESDASGPGSRREFTHQEVEALCYVKRHIDLARSIEADFADGSLWEQALREVK